MLRIPVFDKFLKTISVFLIKRGEVFFFVLFVFGELLFLVSLHEVFWDVISFNGNDAWDFFHENDLNAGGDIFSNHRAAIACPTHFDVDDTVSKADELDVATVSL